MSKSLAALPSVSRKETELEHRTKEGLKERWVEEEEERRGEERSLEVLMMEWALSAADCIFVFLFLFLFLLLLFFTRKAGGKLQLQWGIYDKKTCEFFYSSQIPKCDQGKNNPKEMVKIRM